MSFSADPAFPSASETSRGAEGCYRLCEAPVQQEKLAARLVHVGSVRRQHEGFPVVLEGAVGVAELAEAAAAHEAGLHVHGAPGRARREHGRASRDGIAVLA